MKDVTRIAIVGAGVWGETHGAIFCEHPGAELVAICDRDINRAQALAHRCGIGKAYGSVDEMLAADGFDAVSIVTPDHLHADIAVDCANAGKHLLIEKPIATTVADVHRIVDAVRANGVRAMVDLHNRWSPPFAQAKAEIEAGALGGLRSAYIRLNDTKWVATDMLPWAADSSILWFLGSHSLDTLQWLFGDVVTRVYCASNRGVLDSLGVDTDDVFLSTLEFQNGGIAHMENGWITPNANPCVNDIKCTLTGEKGMVSIDASHHNLIQLFTDHGATVPDILVRNKIHGRVKGFAYESIRSFVDKLQSNEPFIVSIEEAARTSIAILAIMESAKTRSPVAVEYGDL
ncbi:MAG: Gfo/Idh/MocA family oxidoreductase [Clostridia bacterium]|nr:Gfo/Idh/MocA family oxidoreductase [Clostridia bacterium]